MPCQRNTKESSIMKARRYLAICGSLTKAKTTSKLRFDLLGLKKLLCFETIVFSGNKI